jgi:undecaprenyl-phosphate alpha-N-acetylglucosaminyl 1-phosphatetransferase
MNIIDSLWGAILVSFVLSFTTILLLKPIAEKIDLVDIPGGRKQHASATPLIGGIAMLLGFLMSLLLLPDSLKPFRGLIFGSVLLVFVGMLDDFREISPRGRLIAQISALCVMIFWSHVQLENLGNLFGQGSVHLSWLAIPLTLFGAASLINAINMIDGRDGLSGSITLIALLHLMILACLMGCFAQAMVLSLFIASLMAYLCFNFPLPWRPQASCFMGDAGSMLLGFILAWFTISLSQQPNTLAGPAHMLWIVAIPLLDLATVFIKRMKSKRSPFDAGPDHIYNVLEQKGFSKVATLWILLAATLLTNLAAALMIAFQVPELWVLCGFLGMFAGYYLINTPMSLPHQKD